MSDRLTEKREMLKLKHKLIELSWEAAKMADEIDEYLRERGMKSESTGSWTVTQATPWKRTIVELERDMKSPDEEIDLDLNEGWHVEAVTPFRQIVFTQERLPLSEEQFQMYVDLVEKEEEVIE